MNRDRLAELAPKFRRFYCITPDLDRHRDTRGRALWAPFRSMSWTMLREALRWERQQRDPLALRRLEELAEKLRPLMAPFPNRTLGEALALSARDLVELALDEPELGLFEVADA